MLWSTEELKVMDEFKDIPEDTLERKIKAIESAIRGYTNNKFQNINVRFECKSQNNTLLGSDRNLKEGDTIEISQSVSNNGLYVVLTSGEGETSVDSVISDNLYNLVTKVEYPEDVKEGGLSMLRWNLENADKVGIASESLSRHSVTYFNMDKTNTVSGYPISLLGFCQPYVRAKT